jgi:hypothetical protein
VRGQEAAVTWRIRYITKSGHVFFLEGIGFFRLNQDGKIESEREFFDLDWLCPKSLLLCANSVFSVSLWLFFAKEYQPQRHREHRGSQRKRTARKFLKVLTPNHSLPP